MNNIKKILIGTGIVIALILYIWIFNITKPASQKNTENTNNTQNSEIQIETESEIKEITKATDEIISATNTDFKLQINGVIVTFPIKVEDFINETGLNFSNNFSSEANEETNLRPLVETSAYMTTNENDIILIKIKNTSETRIKNIKNCYIYGVNISESTEETINNGNLGLLYTMGGITYKDNYLEIKDHLNSFEWDKAVSSIANNKIANYFAKDNLSITYFSDRKTNIINEIHFEIKEENKESVQTTESIE